uniref:Helper of transposition of ISCARN16, IS21 family n=1 Tax=mine drainage metagenome TaxID=410659 RepID=E6PUR9_9ZZZZ
MRELAVELKQLRMHGMAGAWADLVEQGGSAALESSRWLLEHLLQAETTDRAMRSVSHQMHAAKFPVHRDLAGFDFEGSPVDRKLIHTLTEMAFTDAAQNVVLVGGPGTGKTHLATAIGVSGITRHGKRVRFYSTVDLVNALEQEKTQGKAGRIALSLLRMDIVILDELGYLPFSQAGGALLFHLLSRLYELSILVDRNVVVAAERTHPHFRPGMPFASPVAETIQQRGDASVTQLACELHDQNLDPNIGGEQARRADKQPPAEADI